MSSELEAQVEAQWRISPILATLILSMVAVPLSMVNPRQGRFARLMPAILIYAAYYMFLLSLRNLMLTSTLPLWPGLLVVPVFFLLFVAIPLNLPKSHLKKMRATRGPKGPFGPNGPKGSSGSSDSSGAAGNSGSANGVNKVGADASTGLKLGQEVQA